MSRCVPVVGRPTHVQAPAACCPASHRFPRSPCHCRSVDSELQRTLGLSGRRVRGFPVLGAFPGPGMMPSMDLMEAAGIADDVFATAPELVTVPGIAYGLMHSGELVHVGGRGEAMLGGPVPGPDTVFRIASMTKSFTAGAILILRDAGRLRLDDPIAAHLPFAAGLESLDGPSITIRDLLTMGSGLATDDPWGDRQESLSSAAFDELIAGGLSFCRPPRMAFEYSNTGYALLGRVIEEVSGMSYRDFVIERICAPLGMTATTFDAREVEASRLATGYRLAAGGVPMPEPVVRPGAYSAMGGLLSSIRDIALWVGGFTRAWTSSSAHPVDRWALREAQESARFVGVDDSSEPGADTGSTGYGFGLYVREDRVLGRVVSHSGGYPGFGSHMRWHPRSSWGVVVLGNATYAPVRIAASVVLARIVGESQAAHGAKLPIAVMPWPQTLVAMTVVENLLRGCSDDVAEGVWSPNMDLDVPREERALALGELRESIGVPQREDGSVEHRTPAHASWTVTGELGSARVEMLMTPERVPRIQSLVVKRLVG